MPASHASSGDRQHTLHPARVLLVEDNPADVELTMHTFEPARSANRITLSVVADGVDALRFLRREAPYERQERPDLILLDLNLPRKDGFEVLAELRQDDRLQEIPVLILTTSAAPADIHRAYQRGANGFVTKPVDLDRFFYVVDSIETFWLDVVELPPR